MKTKLINIFELFLILVAQVVVSNNVDFGPAVMISFYPFYILSKPYKTPSYFLMLSAFILGLSIDLFTVGLPGLNAASAVFLAFLQPTLLVVVFRKGDLENHPRPGIIDYGITSFLIYILIGVTIHNLFHTLVENFGTPFISESISRLILSIVINTLIIVFIEFGIYYKNRR